MSSHATVTSVLDELRWRGLLQDATEGAAEHFAESPRTVYIGFDPTGASLHIGTLLPIMGLVHAQRAGHTPIALVGGGTGLIGDPSGKTAERRLLTKEQVAENAEAIRAQLQHFLDFDVKSNPARMRNNLDWLGDLPLVDFLRDIGKHFSVNQMLAKESVKRRLANEETGISFTEFSYALLQSYDFLELHRTEGCTVQMGGSDQWGNITAGIDLVRRVQGARAYGVVSPLITQASGVKFGKTEEGAVWLDAAMTSPFRFYQYWINVEDADVVKYLKYFTLLDVRRIAELEHDLRTEPQKRSAQKALADDVTRRLHGETGLARAQQATRVLFGGEVEGLGADDIADIFADVPSHDVAKEQLAGPGKALVDLLSETGIASSKGDARRSIEGGGVYLNNVRMDDVARSVTMRDAIKGRFLLIRMGKKRYHLIGVRG
ncbi:MAG: tyrosine--tRNA ligase [Gemmatimonadetes bacterium]|nr:tyrosine--tRNA ligase [Gemmatimonadota bacterium]